MTTIPKEIRNRLHLTDGDILLWQLTGIGEVIVKKVLIQ
jgi:AbrB family looped-hinge helix DNA binding protein